MCEAGGETMNSIFGSLNFLMYAVTQVTYTTYNSEISWHQGWYFSIARPAVLRWKTYLLTILAISLLFVPFETSPFLHLVAKGIAGIFWMAWFGMRTPFHKALLNFV
jgi:hypothetical protein